MAKQIPPGRMRLAIFLCTTSGLLCTLAMLLVLVVYGSPYNPNWWWLMAAIWVASFSVPYVLVFPIEWIIDGYRSGDRA